MAWTMAKTSDAHGEVSPGDTINYTVEARNTGEQTVDGISFRDDLSGVLDHASFVAGSATLVVWPGSTVPVADPIGDVLTAGPFSLPGRNRNAELPGHGQRGRLWRNPEQRRHGHRPGAAGGVCCGQALHHRQCGPAEAHTDPHRRAIRPPTDHPDDTATPTTTELPRPRAFPPPRPRPPTPRRSRRRTPRRRRRETAQDLAYTGSSAVLPLTVGGLADGRRCPGLDAAKGQPHPLAATKH